MGEIADGLINGDFDSLTGEYIGQGYGYPRTTDKEHAQATGAQYVRPGKRTGRRNDNFKGIAVYLQRVGLCNKNRANAGPIIIKYAEKVLSIKRDGKKKLSVYAREIQKDFPRFRKWIEENYLNKKDE